jgi:hypothetical protein
VPNRVQLTRAAEHHLPTQRHILEDASTNRRKQLLYGQFLEPGRATRRVLRMRHGANFVAVPLIMPGLGWKN